MNEKLIAIVMVSLVTIVGAFTVVQLSNSAATGAQSWRLSTDNPIDYGLIPYQPRPATGYNYQISIGKCKRQGICRTPVNFEARCLGVEAVYRNGFLIDCVKPGTSYPSYPGYCAHKPLGGVGKGFNEDQFCDPGSKYFSIRQDCYCV